MYTIIERRTINPTRLQETMERAQREFFPHLQTAPGFSGFYLVPDDANGINTAVLVWESKAQADAFESAHRDWLRALDELGHTLQSDNRGDTVVTLEPQR